MSQLLLDFDSLLPEEDPRDDEVTLEALPRGFEGSPYLVREIARIAREEPRRRRVLVTATRREGNELLRQVALTGTSWVGFQVNVPGALATELAAPVLARRGIRELDQFEEQELMEQAIDEVVLSSAPGRFRRLVERVGFRDAVRSSIVALRLGGVHVGRLAVASIDDHEKQALITAVLGSYEHLLESRSAADKARVLETAVQAASDPSVLADRELLLVPGLPKRGLAGRLLRLLAEHGARLLKTDPVVGLPHPKSVLWDVCPPESPYSFLHDVGKVSDPVPSLDGFTAASVYDELRGVLRRVITGGIPWDDVEIVTPDPAVYGSALHALTQPLGIPVTYAVGLPVERTRPGRALEGYFRWVESGYQDSVLRTLFDAGDVQASAPYDWMSGPHLARVLRGLRVGWGRTRYKTALSRALKNNEELRQGRHEDADRFQKRQETQKDTLKALLGFVERVLADTPTGSDEAESSPADVAAGAEAFLSFVPVGTEADETARLRLARILARVQATLTRKTDLAAARAILRGYLQIRIPAPRIEGAAPWSAAPGSLYLTDLEHGGATGRSHTFLVGLDAGRFPGPSLQDPLLLDPERWRLGRGELPLAADRMADRRFLFGRLFSRLRGQVCLSYARWDPSEARGQTPAAELLQAFRLKLNRPSLSFEELDDHLGEAESRVPSPGASPVDQTDWWMAALSSDGGVLLDGTQAVRGAFPWIDRGLRHSEALQGEEASRYLGFLPKGLPDFDPRQNPERVVSASGLGDLGACPRRYFMRYVLGMRPPDDPEFDPARWLDPLRRGSLLHSVYERLLTHVKEQDLSIEDPEVVDAGLQILEEESKVTLLEMPTPSEAVRSWEMENLREDVRSFITMIRAEKPNWLALELRFGFDGDGDVVETSQNPIRVRGAIDRIDDLGTHLRVVDYKTGKARAYDKKAGVYDGGRRLQHLIYSAVASQRFQKPVLTAEYHFPTRRGENQTRSFLVEDLRHGSGLLGTMLETISKGWFPPTDTPDDCWFCDFQEVCGASVDRWYSVTSPMAEWSSKHLEELNELELLRRVRRWENEEPLF